MSQNNALETIIAAWLAMDGSIADVTHIRVQPIIGAADPGETNADADTYTLPTYAGYAALSVADGEIVNSGAVVTINARKTFAEVAGGQMSGSNKLWRFVLEVSIDGGSTYPLKYVSDIINGGAGVVVADGVEPYLEADTGFTITIS